MRYMGGKHYIAKDVAAVLASYRTPGQLFVAPFVGAANVFCRMADPKIGCDSHPEIIALWKAILSGWQPPSVVTEDEYKRVKADKSGDPALRAFIGFGCSFGAKYFGGYATSNPGRSQDYAGGACRGLQRKAKGMSLDGTGFMHADYRTLTPNNSLVYCDPPYANTTGYSGAGGFNSEEFWELMKVWSQNNTVIVSEYIAPVDWQSVWTKEKAVSIALGKHRKVQEHLFKLKGL